MFLNVYNNIKFINLVWNSFQTVVWIRKENNMQPLSFPTSLKELSGPS